MFSSNLTHNSANASGYYAQHIAHPPRNHNYFFNNTDRSLDVYSTYKRIALAAGFNAQVGEKSFDTFLYQHELTSINGYLTCYPNNPSCIDHILTNSPMSFLQTKTIFTGLSDFHKLVLSVGKLHFSKAKTKGDIIQEF